MDPDPDPAAAPSLSQVIDDTRTTSVSVCSLV